MNEIEFIEKYCLVNGKHIKLTKYQKNFLKCIENIKKSNNTNANKNK